MNLRLFLYWALPFFWPPGRTPIGHRDSRDFGVHWSDSEIRTRDGAKKAATGWRKWTRFDAGGSICGIQGTNQNSMVPTNLFHIAIGLGSYTWSRQNLKIMKQNIQASFGTKNTSRENKKDKLKNDAYTSKFQAVKSDLRPLREKRHNVLFIYCLLLSFG